MASQPIPAGNAVAIVSNGGGAGVLAADACAEAGLVVASTGPQARSRLRDVLPAAASLAGPVDTTAAVSPEAFGEALHLAAADDGVAALIAVVVRSASADLLPVLTASPAAGPGHGGRAGPARGRPAAARRRHRPGRARLRLPRSGRPGAGPGRPVRLLAVPAGRHGAGVRRPARGGRPLDRRFVPGADARRRLAVRRGGRPSAALLRHPDGGRSAGPTTPTRPSRRRPAWAVTW